MDSQTLLTINNQPVSIQQALNYLKTTGELPRVIQSILRQHILEAQLAQRPSLESNSLELEQAIINFRIQNNLLSPESFQQWLNSQNFTYAQFRQQFITNYNLQQLKTEVTANKIEKYFTENRTALDQVILSRIVVNDVNLAEELMRQLLDDNRPFEQLARQHSIAPERTLKGLMGVVKISQLPLPLQELITDAQPGDILGPVSIENQHIILRIEEWQPAILESRLKQEIQEQIFEQWLQEQLKNQEIKLLIS